MTSTRTKLTPARKVGVCRADCLGWAVACAAAGCAPLLLRALVRAPRRHASHSNQQRRRPVDPPEGEPHVPILDGFPCHGRLKTASNGHARANIEPRVALATLSEDERLFRDSVYEFADREIRPLVREMDEHAKIPAR